MDEKLYPSEWKDDERMTFYFSPFRDDREVNRRSWDTKMRFWTDMARTNCSSRKSLVFNARKMPEMFKRNGKVPTCLDVVLNEMNRNGTVQKLSDYAASANTGWLSWSVSLLIKRPVRWSYNTLVKGSLSWAYGKVFGKDDDTYHIKSMSQMFDSLPDEDYVFLDLIKSMASDIYQRHSESVTYDITDNVIDFETFHRKCHNICTDEKSFNVAIIELCRQKLCTVSYGADGEKLIRMVSNKNEKPARLSENEMKIYRLKSAETKMEAEIMKINNDMEECRLNAKSCLQQGKKNLALKHLKRKKMLESSLAQKDQAIDKINNLISIIQQTESQKQIIDAYSSGVKAFKGITQQYGLSENKVDETMSDIQEVFDANEEINQSVSRPIGDQLDEDELEKELEELLGRKEPPRSDRLPANTGRESELDISDLLDLPEVPSHDPSITPPRTVLDPSSRQKILIPQL